MRYINGEYEISVRQIDGLGKTSPNVLEVIKALSFIATKRNTISTKEIIKWAKEYAEEWFNKNMNGGEQE